MSIPRTQVKKELAWWHPTVLWRFFKFVWVCSAPFWFAATDWHWSFVFWLAPTGFYVYRLISYRMSIPGRLMHAFQTSLGMDDNRPKLKKMSTTPWGCTLYYRMPVGVSLSKLLNVKESLEQWLDCEMEITYRGGLFVFKIGSLKVPEMLHYWEFYGNSSKNPRPTGSLVFGVGIGQFGPIWADLSDLTHILVGGMSKMGKSGLIRQMLTYLCTIYPPSVLQIYLIDLKMGAELNTFETLPHCGGRRVIRRAEDVLRMLDPLVAEMERRLALFDAHPKQPKNIDQYNELEVGAILPHMLCVIDELGELRPEFAEANSPERQLRHQCLSILARLCQLGRAAGLHVVGATQRSDVSAVPGVLKANLGSSVIAFRTADKTNSQVLVEDSSAFLLPSIRGRAIFRRESAVTAIVQVPYIEASEAKTLLEKQWGVHRPIMTLLDLDERAAAKDEEPVEEIVEEPFEVVDPRTWFGR